MGVWVGWGLLSPIFFFFFFLFFFSLFFILHSRGSIATISYVLFENFVFLSMSLFQFHIPLDAIIIIYIAINSYAKRYMPPIFYRSYLSWMAACMVDLSRQGRFSTSISAGLIGIFAPGRRTSHWRLGAQKLEFRA